MATVKGILRSFELVESFKLSKGQKVPFKFISMLKFLIYFLWI